MRPPTSRISRGQLSAALGFLNRRVEARLGSAQFPARIERVIPASIDTGGICQIIGPMSRDSRALSGNLVQFVRRSPPPWHTPS